MTENNDDDTIDNKPVDEAQNAAEKTVKKKNAATKDAAKKTAAKKTGSKKDTANKAVPKKAPAKKTVKNDKRTGTTGRRDNDRVMPGLLKNLQGVFDKIYSDNTVRDRDHDKLADEFTTHMQKAFLEMHKQIEEREHLLETRLKSIDRTHRYQLQRVKWLSIPVTLLSVIAIVYLFSVVRVMERSMTSMSGNMHQMTSYMEVITGDTSELSANTANMTQHIGSMNNQMGSLNTNVAHMTGTVNNLMVDVHQMSRAVSPTMQGINRFIP